VRTYGRKVKNLNLQPASGGLFEVTFNGELIFSKKSLDRFPEKGEIVGLIDQRR